MKQTTYKLTVNVKNRTYTIRQYVDGKLTAKYRSYQQSKDEFSTHWTQDDIKVFLKSDDYYKIK